MEQKDESYYIERILDGETEYFSVFLDRYSRPLYTLVVQIVGCPEDAEELLQDIFLKAFRNLNRYKGECRFSTWIYRIAYNTAISATRKKKQEFLSYRMMERVHQEAEKQTKRKTRVGWAALLISALALVGLGVYVLTFYLEFNFADVMPQMNVRQDSSLFGFYVYIALLALVLLGLDYWLRKKYIWK
ncbi:sigma-70 family RNA polymerase sigma factor [Bacteroides thetaiotaomicron]|uniref:RNA polymerase sigma factor n=1 Tax=Bacteroides thetaiotaomicron TaxID=818 RepID=UPI0021656F08|nr:sigma-70 family RNA polymerase sigma factor [Bacteroides thetaiotaomicron]MCS2714378.1 sigma-70 family RNA polymerase sigma factor [Bacteroides thetaiotaomicron]MCS2874615.1 sigma-70 family RNA polymerase sigma factor [Bacteroides thetaiotaomicron]